MKKVFISRELNSFDEQILDGQSLEIIGKSLIDFSPVPFEENLKTDWIFFYSKNGIKFFFEQASETFRASLISKQIALMGEGSIMTLKRYTDAQYHFAAFQHEDAQDRFVNLVGEQSVLFVKATTSLSTFETRLPINQRSELIVYENSDIIDFELPFCDILAFTSPKNVANYFRKYEFNHHQQIITIGATTSDSVRKIDSSAKVLECDKPDFKKLLLLIKQIGSENSPNLEAK
jgi:uroporphyrinogen-III synthase